jgi:hypothetical protein
MTKYSVGDVIPVRIGGRVIETIIDKNKTQRLPNTLSFIGMTESHSKVNLDTLSTLYREGGFTDNEWFDFYSHIGYSLGGFSSLSYFSEMEIVNPLWDDDPELVTAEPTIPVDLENIKRRLSDLGCQPELSKAEQQKAAMDTHRAKVAKVLAARGKSST